MSPLLLAYLMLPQTQMALGQGGSSNQVVLRDGLGDAGHRVSTRNVLAQKFFNQGLSLTYGFNHHAAVGSFEEAARLDPGLAMAHWGIAYALGPNINMPIDAATNKRAHAEAQKAMAMKGHASPVEAALIEALAKRYDDSENPDFASLNKAYALAMREVARQYPTDSNVLTLYAESLMDLHPWRLWGTDGRPGPDTQEIVAILQSVLKKNPNHIGANHFLIHAVEASPTPELARDAARRLSKLAPESGHLVHMPSHVYLRVGDWSVGMKSNEAAIRADEAFLKDNPSPGIYPMYYVHNYDMYRACADMAGNYKGALWAAQNVADKAGTMGPMGEPFVVVPLLQKVRFAKWSEILTEKTPSSTLPFVQAVFHYAQGMASASTRDHAAARSQLEAFTSHRAKVGPETSWGFTPADQVLGVLQHLLDARIARAEGRSSDEIGHLKLAVTAYDRIGYNEPADFYYPVRETLGAAYIRSNRFADAVSVFAEELRLHPNSGRALFGLWTALKVEGNLDSLDEAAKRFKSAWKDADQVLRIEDM